MALDRGLFRRAADALADLGAVSAIDDFGGAVVQFSDDSGRLFTLYETIPGGTDWEVRNGPFVAHCGVEPPDMDVATACPFDCRWPDLVALIAAARPPKRRPGSLTATA